MNNHALIALLTSRAQEAQADLCFLQHAKKREFDLSKRPERGMHNLLGCVDGGLFIEEGESSQSR